MIELISRYFPDLTEHQKKQFEALSPLYREWNGKINVISRADIDSLYLHHVLHSLAIAKVWKEEGLTPANVMDLGTGGGFPGIPLAILYPASRFLLVDSIGKKITVAGNISDSVGLGNVTAVKARAEEVDLREYFGERKCAAVVSRAVTRMEKFIPWVKGKFTEGIYYLKGGDMGENGELLAELHEASAKCRMKFDSIKIYDIEKMFGDEYFLEKRVIRIPPEAFVR